MVVGVKRNAHLGRGSSRILCRAPETGLSLGPANGVRAQTLHLTMNGGSDRRRSGRVTDTGGVTGEPGESAASATITVSRTSPEDIGLRETFVSLDGESIAIVDNGESVTRTVSAGSREVRVHDTLFRKRGALELGPGNRRGCSR